MPIIKKDECMPLAPIVLLLYGIAGSGKTSASCTADTPLLIDCENGARRAVNRCDTLVAQKWQEVMAEYETMKSYKTIICDTAKSAVDEYLSNYAIEQDARLSRNTLKRFGKMGEEFKLFVNQLKASGCDLIFIAHDKETSENDVIKHSPDCTGMSKELLLRTADQVGYLSVVNGKRVISFEPSDNYVGKNVGNLPAIEIPDATDPKFETFMADVINQVKEAIQNKSEAQRKANEMVKHLREELAKADSEKAIAAIFKECADLPQILKAPFFSEMVKTLEPKGFVFDKDAKKFVAKKAEAKAEKK